MIGLRVTFDLGRYHATPWDAHANDGAVEWPPSPWRVQRALYAVARTHVGLQPHADAIDRALRKLALAAPPAYDLPPSTVAHTRHYFPSRLHAPSRPGETDLVFDAFRALDPEAALGIWWDVELERPERAGLAATARALSHLGRSESVSSAAVVDADPPAHATRVLEAGDGPAPVGDRIDLLVVDPASGEDPLAVLAQDVGTLRRQRFRHPPGTRFVTYLVEDQRSRQVTDEGGDHRERPTIARYRIVGGGRPPLREAVAIGSVMRDALQSKFGGGDRRKRSPCFSGRAGDDPRADQHLHAHYLVTPDREARRADHVTVWAPEGFGAEEVTALARVSRLTHWTFDNPVEVVLTALGTEETLQLPALLGESDVWRSLTPFALPRHPKRRGGRIVGTPEEQIAREWLHRHPDGAQLLDVTLLDGDWTSFRRSRPGASRQGAPQLVGARLRFDRPVHGPIALGALSHFGLGLFVVE